MEPSPLFDDLRLTTAGLFFGLFPPKRLRRLTADLRTLRDAVHPSAITDGVTPPIRA